MRKRRVSFAIIFAIVFIDMVGFGILIPLLPYYGKTFLPEIEAIASYLGIVATLEGLVIAVLFSVYSLMQFFFSPVWGRLSDRIGRRPVLLFNLLGSVAAYILFGIAGSLLVLFFSRVLQGIFGAKIATAQAYIADATDVDSRAKGMGMVGAALGLGFIFGPAIAGILVSLEPVVFKVEWLARLMRNNIYALPGFFAAGISFVNFILVYVALPETVTNATGHRVEQRYLNLRALWKALKTPNLAPLLLILFLVMVAFSGMESTFALWAHASLGISDKTNSYLFAYIGVLIAVVQGGLIGVLAKKFGERLLVVAGVGLMAVSLLLIPLSPSTGILMLILIPLALGNGLNTPSMNSLISQTSHSSDYGGILGFSQSTASLARIIGPLAGGLVYDAVGIQYPFILGAIIMGVALILGWRFLLQHPSEVVFQE